MVLLKLLHLLQCESIVHVCLLYIHFIHIHVCIYLLCIYIPKVRYSKCTHTIYIAVHISLIYIYCFERAIKEASGCTELLQCNVFHPGSVMLYPFALFLRLSLILRLSLYLRLSGRLAKSNVM